MTTATEFPTAITPDLERVLKGEFYDNLPIEGDYMQRPRFAESGRMDTRSIAGRLGLVSFDTALPLQWYEAVHEAIGFWPQMLGFVWCYDVQRIGGEPVPCTYAALIALRFYQAVSAR